MHPALQLFANHTWLLWIILAVGIWNVLVSTVFYSFFAGLCRRFHEARFVEASIQQKPFLRPLFAMAVASTDSNWARLLGIVMGLVLIAIATAGIVILS